MPTYLLYFFLEWISIYLVREREEFLTVGRVSKGKIP